MHKAPAGLSVDGPQGCHRARVGSLIGHRFLTPLHDPSLLRAVSYKLGVVLNVIDN